MTLVHLPPVTINDGPELIGHLPDVVRKLLEGVERSLTSAHSRRAYRSALLHFLRWCSASPGRTLNRLSVLQYKDDIIAASQVGPNGENSRSCAPASVNQRLAAIRALAQEACDTDLLSASETSAIRRIRGENGSASRVGMWLNKAELDRIMLRPDRATIRGQRDFALLAVLFSTGLRRAEVVELAVSSLQQREGHWGLIDVAGKGGKLRSVPIPLWVKDAIICWLITTKIVRGPIFRSISRHGKLGLQSMSEESVKLILHRYAREEDLPQFRPHDGRRTCARILRSSGAALEDIQELLGHSSVQTTQRYLGKRDALKSRITDAITAPRV